MSWSAIVHEFALCFSPKVAHLGELAVHFVKTSVCKDMHSWQLLSLHWLKTNCCWELDDPNAWGFLLFHMQLFWKMKIPSLVKHAMEEESLQICVCRNVCLIFSLLTCFYFCGGISGTLVYANQEQFSSCYSFFFFFSPIYFSACLFLPFIICLHTCIFILLFSFLWPFVSFFLIREHQ